MEIKEIQNIFKEHGFNENNCSFFRQEDINDIAKEIVEKINYTHSCTEVCDCEFERIDSERIQCIKCEMIQSRR